MGGGEKSRKRVGFILKSKVMEETMLRTESSEGSIIGILLNSNPVEIALLQIYMPTSDIEDQTIVVFYDEI